MNKQAKKEKLYTYKFFDEVRRLMQGAIDLHCHAGPALIPRRIDGVDAVQQAAEAGLAGVLIKDHHVPTARDVLYIKKHMLERAKVSVDLIGGIALNHSVGGLNPHAVEAALHFGARIVYLPTVSSRSHKLHHQKPIKTVPFPATVKKLLDAEPIDLLDKQGNLPMQLKLIMEQVRDENAILSTGHLSVSEIIAVLNLAREMRLKRVLVNHPTFITAANENEMVEFVSRGARIEFSACMSDPRCHYCYIPFEELFRLIRLVGVKSASICSDLGQHDTPPFVEGLMVVADGLMSEGMRMEELKLLFRENPAKLLY